MSVARLSERARASQAIWPGFVDAMTALLLVLMFVLSIFMIIQFVLREQITGAETEIERQGTEIEQQQDRIGALSEQLSSLSNVLAMEQARGADLERDLGVARANLTNREGEIERLDALAASLTDERAALRGRVASFEAQVASLLAERSDLRADVAALETENAEEVDAKEALQAALARARSEIDAEQEAARLAAARREALESTIASLEAEQAETSDALSSLKAEDAANLALIAALEDERGDSLERIAALDAAREDAAARAEEQATTREAADAQAAQEAAARLSAEEEAKALAAARDAALRRAASLETELSEEERLKLAEAAAAKALRERLANADAELTAMTLNLEQRRREAEETLTLLAAAEAARVEAEAGRAALAEDLDEEEAARARQEALLALARNRVAARQETISDQAKDLALLNEQAGELRDQLATISAQLEASEASDEASDTRIANLGQRLNAALAREAQLKAREVARLEREKNDLESYRSEFFGEMRKALGSREDIRIVGDRFIFQSEVLFGPGEASLGAEGRRELSDLGGALRDVIDRIPESIDWLLVAEGHTDDTPLSGGGRYRNNWELSLARALSVVQFLSGEEDIPPSRLAALGYGEFQPVAEADTPEARARNRRIELKFTARPPREPIEPGEDE